MLSVIHASAADIWIVSILNTTLPLPTSNSLSIKDDCQKENRRDNHSAEKRGVVMVMMMMES